MESGRADACAASARAITGLLGKSSPIRARCAASTRITFIRIETARFVESRGIPKSVRMTFLYKTAAEGWAKAERTRRRAHHLFGKAHRSVGTCLRRLAHPTDRG